MGKVKFWAAFAALSALLIAGTPAVANTGKTAWDGEWEGTLRHADLPCSPCRVKVSISNGVSTVRGATEVRYLTVDTEGAVVAEVPIYIAGNPVRASCRVFGKAQAGAIAANGSCGNYSTQAELSLRRISASAVTAPASAQIASAETSSLDGEWEGTVRHPDMACSPCKLGLTITNGVPSLRSQGLLPDFAIGKDGAVFAELALNPAGNLGRSVCRLAGRAQSSGIVASGTCGSHSAQAELRFQRVSTAAAAPQPSVQVASAPGSAASWDGEWQGTLRHPDLPCSPCSVRLTVTNGRPSVRANTGIPSFILNNDGTVSAEIAIRVAGNGVPMNCTLRGRAQTSSMAASGTCGLYAIYAEMDLKRVGAPPATAVAAVPAPLQPAPQTAPVPAPAPAPAPFGSTPPASAPPPAAFGAGTQPIRFGSITYGIEPGSTIGQVVTGNWLASCGSNGRSAPLKHQPGTQPNSKTLSEEFERVLRGAGYVARTGEEPADYLLVGKVTSISMNFCVRENTRPFQSSGEGTVRIDWNVVALQGGRSVYMTSTTGSFVLPPGERSTEGGREVFAGTFRDALQRLAGDSGFRNAVASASVVAAAARSEPTLFIRPVPRYTNGITANMDKILPSVVEIKRGNGSGTGFVIDARGYLLTNAHVVGNAEIVTLRFNDGQTMDAKVLRRDALRDIALLKIERAGLRPLPMRFGKLTLTEKVFAIGNPLGLSQTVTDGIVSAYRQRPNDGQEYIQASVNVTFGNSGGPLLDTNGNVVGVAVSVLGSGSLGLNFFIPIESALQHMDLKLGN